MLLALLGVLLHGGAGIGDKGLLHGLPHPQTQELVRARLLSLRTASTWKSKSDFIEFNKPIQKIKQNTPTSIPSFSNQHRRLTLQTFLTSRSVHICYFSKSFKNASQGYLGAEGGHRYGAVVKVVGIDQTLVKTLVSSVPQLC